MQPLPSQKALPEQLRTLLLTLGKIAQSYFMLGHLEQALQLFQIGMQLLHVPEVTQRDQARLLLHYGNMLTVKTLFENAPIEEALSVLEQAKQLATKLDDEQLIADALDGIGYAHYIIASNKREGDPHVLRAYFQEALERRKVLHDERGVSESLFHLGLIAEPLGQMEVARSSDALRHLGLLEQAQGNFTQAQQYLTESLHLREHMGMHPYLPFTYHAVADVYLAQGNVELASSHCQKALDLSRKMDIKKALIFSLLTHGRICQEKQEQKQARDYFEQAYDVAQAIDLKYVMQQAASALQHLSTNSGAQ